jgi:ABC-type lipoprotein release transport system permease subunit
MSLGVLALIAWRNLWRNTRRTLLTTTTVSLGLALLLIFLGLGDGGHKQMINSAVRSGSGHVVIQADGYQQSGGLANALTPGQRQSGLAWLDSVRAQFSIQGVLSRTFSSALASSADGSAGVMLIGLQPSGEQATSRFADKIVEGEFLEDGDSNQVLIGKGVARKLDVGLGDKLVLMSQAVEQTDIESILARVRGIIATGQEDFDQILVLMPLETSQRFLNLSDRAHQIAVILEDDEPSERLAALGKVELSGVEVLSWHDALPELRDFIKVDDGGNYVFHAILFLLIGFMVLNTLLMSVLERDREFSLLDALGFPPLSRFLMVMIEALFIGCLASAAGLALGYLGHYYLATKGLPLSWFNLSEGEAAGVAFEPIMYSYLTWGRILQSIVVVFLLTLALALFPARRAAGPGEVQALGNQ